MVKIPPSDAHKYVSPKVGHEIAGKTKGKAFGKVVENLGKIALTKWHRITHFVGTLIKERKFDWVNDAEVLEQLTDRVKELGKDIKGAEPKQRDEAELKEINEDIPALVTKLKTSGVKNKLGIELLHDLKALKIDVEADIRHLEADIRHLELRAPSQRGTFEAKEEPVQWSRKDKSKVDQPEENRIGKHRRGKASIQAFEVGPKDRGEEKAVPVREEPKSGTKSGKAHSNGQQRSKIEKPKHLDQAKESPELKAKASEAVKKEKVSVADAKVSKKVLKKNLQDVLIDLVKMADKDIWLRKSLSQNLSEFGLGEYSKDNLNLDYFLYEKNYDELSDQEALKFANTVLQLVIKGKDQAMIFNYDVEAAFQKAQEVYEALKDQSTEDAKVSKVLKKDMQGALKDLVEMADKEIWLRKFLSKDLSEFGLGKYSKDNRHLDYYLYKKNYDELSDQEAMKFANEVLKLVIKGKDQSILGSSNVNAALKKAEEVYEALKKFMQR